ncbi:hypothetical protein EVAR_458_1 [Eumeta japonica]|uniref:Uncharacterized protein n=1 Tax=Eumeta variegata TaxID=151549 RepID=A0A4C1SD63_EUMVA|nr:hypothetical protein EVAR_458_1 [Eumeta japonica]
MHPPLTLESVLPKLSTLKLPTDALPTISHLRDCISCDIFTWVIKATFSPDYDNETTKETETNLAVLLSNDLATEIRQYLHDDNYSTRNVFGLHFGGRDRGVLNSRLGRRIGLDGCHKQYIREEKPSARPTLRRISVWAFKTQFLRVYLRLSPEFTSSRSSGGMRGARAAGPGAYVTVGAEEYERSKRGASGAGSTGGARDSDSESSGSPCAECAAQLYRLPGGARAGLAGEHPPRSEQA